MDELSGVGNDAADAARRLNSICRAAVSAARSGEPAVVQHFQAGIETQLAAMRKEGSSEVADFMAALSKLAGGASLEQSLEGLVEPYRKGLRAVAADIRAPEDTEVDWVAALCAQVASILSTRDSAAASDLADDLGLALDRPGLDEETGAFLRIILGVLRGEDLRGEALGLSPRFREAYFKLIGTMRELREASGESS